MNEKFDVLIIGAGLSGLLSGVYLSNKGLKVCLLDKNNKPGGMIQPFKREGIYLETGMNFFGAVRKNQIQYHFFDIFDIAGDIELIEFENFELILNNKKYIIPNNFKRFKKQLSKYFPCEKKGIKKYLKKISKTLKSLKPEKVAGNKTFMQDLRISAEEFINSCVSDNELRQVLKFNGLLFGSDFSTIPYYLYAIITGTFLSSAGMFKNGTIEFISALERKIINNSGKILTRKEVKEIITENNKVVSVKCSDNTEYFADFYISTLHPQILFPKIKSPLLKKYFLKRISELKNTSGSFIINILLKEKSVLYDSAPKIIQNNDRKILLYFPFSGKQGDYAGTAKIMTEDDFSFYEQFSKTRKGHRGNDYETHKKLKVKEILEKVEKIYPDFNKKIKSIYTSSPLTFEYYTGSPKGSSYGIEKNSLKPEQTILPYYTKFKNLFLSGQSVNFHGLTGVSITTYITCNALLSLKVR